MATILAATRLRGVAAIAAGAIGGMIAVQAAVVTFVAAGFSAQEAPREYALLWLPAMTGLAKDLGGPDVIDEMPLWVRISQDAGLVSWLIVLLTGFALAYAVRRGRVARIQTSQA